MYGVGRDKKKENGYRLRVEWKSGRSVMVITYIHTYYYMITTNLLAAVGKHSSWCVAVLWAATYIYMVLSVLGLLCRHWNSWHETRGPWKHLDSLKQEIKGTDIGLRWGQTRNSSIQMYSTKYVHKLIHNKSLFNYLIIIIIIDSTCWNHLSRWGVRWFGVC